MQSRIDRKGIVRLIITKDIIQRHRVGQRFYPCCINRLQLIDKAENAIELLGHAGKL